MGEKQVFAPSEKRFEAGFPVAVAEFRRDGFLFGW